jgi:anti-sigma-K factor RskA
MIDERHQEAAALYALDLLEGAERTAFESVLASDRELRRLVDQLRETSANIALLATPAEPSAFLRERILADVADRSPTSADHTIPFRLPFWAGWAVASVFIVATGYFVGVNFNTRSQFGALRENERLARIDAKALSNQLEAERLISRRQIDSLRLAQADISDLKKQNALADLKIDSLASLVANTPDARAIAVWNPHTQEGILTVTKLPALADGKDYQLWVVDPQYPIPVDGGVFQVDPVTGEARVTFKPNKPVATVAKFAVSLERKGGVPKAEGTMMLLSY